MSASTSKLQDVQAALVERGVEDVKFFLALSEQTTLDEVANDAASLLRDHLDGKCTPVKEIGDKK